MARGVNKAILVGNLGNDPETKYTQGGLTITKVSLATTNVRKDRDGNTQENTQWHRVTFFGKLAEIAGEYLRKGSQVYIEGEIRYDKYTGQDGVEKYFTEIVANEMQMLGGRGEGGGGQGRGGGEQGRSRDGRGRDDYRHDDRRDDHYDDRDSRRQDQRQQGGGQRGGGSRAGQAGAPQRQRPQRATDRRDAEVPADYPDDDIPFARGDGNW